MYHGKQRGVDPKQLSRYACVLTTYTTMGMEAASKEDLKKGSSLSQPVELPDSDEEDNTAALPGDTLCKQLEQDLSRILCVAYRWACLCHTLVAFINSIVLLNK